MDDLFAAANVVVPRREPHGDALVNGARVLEEVAAQEACQASAPSPLNASSARLRATA